MIGLQKYRIICYKILKSFLKDKPIYKLESQTSNTIMNHDLKKKKKKCIGN